MVGGPCLTDPVLAVPDRYTDARFDRRLVTVGGVAGQFVLCALFRGKADRPTVGVTQQIPAMTIVRMLPETV